MTRAHAVARSRLVSVRWYLLVAALVLWGLSGALPAAAQDADPEHVELRALIQEFVGIEGNYRDISAVVARIAIHGDAAAVSVLQTLEAGALYVRNSDDLVFAGAEGGPGLIMADPITAAPIGEIAVNEATRIRVNNAVRRAVRDAVGNLTLLSENAVTRRQAAQTIFASRDRDVLPLLEEAIATEKNPSVLIAMEEARAAIMIGDPNLAERERLNAIEIIRGRGDQAALNLLKPLAAGEGPVAEAAARAVSAIETNLQLWGIGQNVWFGISLGSVLLLAAIGLAITFGVMGVINMAHGEMVMLGAYTTFVVQEIFRTSFPSAFDWSLIVALPAAFLFTALIGVLMERGLIRWLYGRPLETLLATFGVSLIIQQAVRTVFGPTNVQVSNPSYMSGSFDIGQISVTYSRFWIVIFAIVVFIALMVIIRRTWLGLRMRAVTQNRRMASALGIRTPWVDAMTFGLGSGIAGLAGVALSQIDNVSPNLGQTYIIDSFMVVVFGGVGNLWGTLVGAMSLGVVNKFLEPYAGAVVAKILVLVAIILFIQRRPRGLFALKGRAIET